MLKAHSNYSRHIDRDRTRGIMSAAEIEPVGEPDDLLLMYHCPRGSYNLHRHRPASSLRESRMAKQDAEKVMRDPEVNGITGAR